MSIDERTLARQMQAADERRRREQKVQLAEKAIEMQELRARHRASARPSRGDVERAIGYTVGAMLAARPEGYPIRVTMENTIIGLLEQAGFDRSQAGDVLHHMIATASSGRERWLIKRETERTLARLLAD